jgi:hypothetical protein
LVVFNYIPSFKEFVRLKVVDDFENCNFYFVEKKNSFIIANDNKLNSTSHYAAAVKIINKLG